MWRAFAPELAALQAARREAGQLKVAQYVVLLAAGDKNTEKSWGVDYFPLGKEVVKDYQNEVPGEVVEAFVVPLGNFDDEKRPSTFVYMEARKHPSVKSRVQFAGSARIDGILHYKRIILYR